MFAHSEQSQIELCFIKYWKFERIQLRFCMPAIISEWGSTDLWYEHLERAVSNSSGHFSFSPSHILSLILQFLPSFTAGMLMSYEPSYWIYWFLPWFFWDSNVVRRNNAKVSEQASKARPQVELGSDYAWSVSTLQALQHSLQHSLQPRQPAGETQIVSGAIKTF